MVKSRGFQVIILAVFFTATAFAGDIKKSDILDKYQKVESNLLVGLESENYGLRTSSAYFLGSIQSERAIIPLLRMLKSGDTEEERILAALSLCKINSERGLFAVKRAITFDDSERVQRVCKGFYCAQKLKELKGRITVEDIKLAQLNLEEEFQGTKLVDFAN